MPRRRARRRRRACPAGVWARALASRFPTAWRSRSSSPVTVVVAVDRQLDGPVGVEHPGVVDQVGGDRRRGRPARAPAAVPGRAGRAAACRRPARPCALRRPRSGASRRAGPPAGRTLRGGTAPHSRARTSAASAARARRRRRTAAAGSPTARRSANARSICASISLSAAPSRPTSVRGSLFSMRCERSPAAIAPAVCSIRPSGRRPSRTRISASTPTATSAIAPTSSSIIVRRCTVLWTSSSGTAITSVR